MASQIKCHGKPQMLDNGQTTRSVNGKLVAGQQGVWTAQTKLGNGGSVGGPVFFWSPSSAEGDCRVNHTWSHVLSKWKCSKRAMVTNTDNKWVRLFVGDPKNGGLRPTQRGCPQNSCDAPSPFHPWGCYIGVTWPDLDPRKQSTASR